MYKEIMRMLPVSIFRVRLMGGHALRSNLHDVYTMQQHDVIQRETVSSRLLRETVTDSPDPWKPPKKFGTVQLSVLWE